jgi:hypothetical protein
MQHETNRRSLTTAQYSSSRLASVPGLQLTQSSVRKFSASADHWLPFSEHSYVGGSAARLSTDCEWQSVCFGFCRCCQRDGGKHSGYQQSAVAGHDHNVRYLRRWSSKREGQYSERELERSRLLERWN